MSHYYDRADVTVSHEFYAFSYTKIIDMLVGHWGFILYYLCEPFCTPHILLGHVVNVCRENQIDRGHELLQSSCHQYLYLLPKRHTKKANTKRVCMDS